MDTMPYPATEGKPEVNYSASSDVSMPGSDVSILSDESERQRLHDDLNLEGRVPDLSAKNLPAVGDNGKHVQSNCCLVVTDETGTRSPNSHSAIDSDGILPPGQPGLQAVFVSSETGSFSEASSQGGYETVESTVGSECDPNSVLKSVIDESDNDLMGSSEARDTSSSEDVSGSAKRRNTSPQNISWKYQPVDIEEIPARRLESPNSDASDLASNLGDRWSYENIKSKERQLNFSFDLKGSQENLTLQDRFYDALIRVHEEKKGFFPRGNLSSLVTQDCVFDELSQLDLLNNMHNATQIRAYAKRICEEREIDDKSPPTIKSFKKIFVVLTLVEKTSSIIKFLEEDINDLDLPLIKIEKSRNRFDLQASRKPGEVLECFRNWSQSKVQAFEEWQWTTISPFFHKGEYRDVRHFRLQDSVLLPFTSDSRRQRGTENEFPTEIVGGQGRVFKANIHPDHHNFDLPKPPDQGFAIKRLLSQNKPDFKKEVEMLKMFSANAHPHLISLLATYEQFGVYYLIFPCAQGDLTHFWKVVKPRPSFDFKTIKWVAEQCKGLAHGLLKIHRYRTSNSKSTSRIHERRYGRHGDLKPENILWFDSDDNGTLKISDFGLSEYSTINSKSYRPKSRVSTSMSYRPPECDVKDGQIGQSYDIWTLGCLYLEFITWLLGGWEYVKIFERKRMSFDTMWGEGMLTDTFFELVECPKSRSPSHPNIIAARVKPAVKNFMAELRSHELCTSFLHDFIDLISRYLLVVKPNDPLERGRISSEEIHVKLTGMLTKFEDPDYACTPTPLPDVQDPAEHSWTSQDVVEVDTEDPAAEALRWKKFPSYTGPFQERPKSRLLSVTKNKYRRVSNAC